MISTDLESIVAQCTPKGTGAIALIRISGTDACPIAARVSRLLRKTIVDVPTHTIHYGSVIDAKGADIDRVLFMVMHAPHTFTGQDTVEITCHNNSFIIETIIERIIASGARLANHGEFTKRAVLNGKMDLVQAESLNEFIHASTQQALKVTLAQLKGSLSAIITTIEKQLVKALSLSEISFEFIDEENMQFGDQIKDIIEETTELIALLTKSFNIQQHLREGSRIALIGSVNVGKSSLLNILAKTDRAITSPLPGTTRDVVETGIYRGGMHITLADTAGLRQTSNTIEQLGIERSYREAQKADLILLIVDGSRDLTPEEIALYLEIVHKYQEKILLIYTKADLPQVPRVLSDTIISITVSATTHKNIKELEALILEKIKALLETSNVPFLLNQRQSKLISHLKTTLQTVQKLLTDRIHYEILSYHLKDACAQVSELTGKSISEAAMDSIFNDFCIGK